MKLIIVSILALIALSACGKVDQIAAHYTGNASEVCQGGVIYLQFTSGTSVKYNPDGKIATCVK